MNRERRTRKELLQHMAKIVLSIRQMEAEADALHRQGRAQELIRKHKAIEIAKQEWRKLDALHKRKWKQDRRSAKTLPNPHAIPFPTFPLSQAQQAAYTIGEKAHTYRQNLTSFIPPTPMSQTATPTNVKSLFKNSQAKAPQQQKAVPASQPKPIPQNQETKAAVEHAFRVYLQKRYGNTIRRGKRLDQIKATIAQLFPNLGEPSDLAA